MTNLVARSVWLLSRTQTPPPSLIDELFVMTQSTMLAVNLEFQPPETPPPWLAEFPAIVQFVSTSDELAKMQETPPPEPEPPEFPEITESAM